MERKSIRLHTASHIDLWCCCFTRTDFLLVRDSAGRLMVREFTGTVLAGQEEPRIRVPPPRSKEKKCVRSHTLNVISPAFRSQACPDLEGPRADEYASWGRNDV